MRAEGQQRDGEVFRGVVDSASVVGAEVCSWNARVCARKCSSLRAHPPGPVIAPVGAPGGYPSAGCFSNRSIQPPRRPWCFSVLDSKRPPPDRTQEFLQYCYLLRILTPLPEPWFRHLRSRSSADFELAARNSVTKSTQ